MRIVVVRGHPDRSADRFCNALAAAYESGAGEAKHEIRRLSVGALEFAPLRTRGEWESAAPDEAVRAAQEDLAWAEHWVIVYPLWLGAMPALLKGFFEQTLRPGFAVRKGASATSWRKLLAGRSARIVVTMGMPAWVHRWFFGAHCLKSLERDILGFVGVGPVRSTLIGSIESVGDARRRAWLARMQELGRAGR